MKSILDEQSARKKISKVKNLDKILHVMDPFMMLDRCVSREPGTISLLAIFRLSMRLGRCYVELHYGNALGTLSLLSLAATNTIAIARQPKTDCTMV